ncbi:MAG: Hcp family type VI secretion system effector [Candidatus Binatia bacterium]
MARSRWSLSSWAALAFGALLGTPHVAAAADQIFVLVDGIAGSSTDARHVGWIDAYAAGNSVAIAMPTPTTGGQGTVTSFSDFSVLKGIDSASPALFVTAAKGQHLRTVDVEFVRPGQEPFTYFKIQLSDATITGVRTNANSTDDSITEFVTFSYRRIRWEYTPQRADGSPGTKVIRCWDVAQRVDC